MEMKLEDFRAEVLTAMKDKPKEWRYGQFVFNYIDSMYGVARHVQFNEGVDCFYVDSKIDEFIYKCYEVLNNTTLLANREIVKEISDMVESHPDLRFGQILATLGIINYSPDVDSDGVHKVIDPFGEESGTILNRIKNRLKYVDSN